MTNSLAEIALILCCLVRRRICRVFHRSIYRPVNGQYTCQTCLEQFPAWRPE